MAVHLIWSPLAKADFKEAVAYIRADNPIAAETWRKSLIERVELLADFPELGSVVPKQSDLSLREIIYRRYRIVYRYFRMTDSIQIIRIWHMARDEPEFENLT